MTAVQKHEPAPVPVAVGPNEGGLLALLNAAVDKGTSVESMEKLTALYERAADRHAAGAYAQAFATFKARCPVIPRSTTKRIVTQSGAGYDIHYAELDEIERTIGPHLTASGLSYAWGDETLTDGFLELACRVFHVGGHMYSASVKCPLDAGNPKMSAADKAASARTRAKRYSLEKVLGLVTGDDNPAAAEADPTPLDEAQRIAVEDLLAARCEGKPKGKAEAFLARFLAFMGAASVAEIRAADFEKAAQALRPKEGA